MLLYKILLERQSHKFSSLMTVTAKVDNWAKARILEHHVGFPLDAIFHCFPRCPSRELNQK